jgi:hypothetical protein
MQDVRLVMHLDLDLVLAAGLRRRIVGSARAVVVCALSGCAVDRAPPSPASFSFALIGDMPYRDADEPRVAALLRDIDDDPSVRFILHAGDLKGSGEPCSDELLSRRLAQLRDVRTALVYTPGDNEWTDCHRPAAGGHHPLERLAMLRRIAYADPERSFGRQPLRLRSQASGGQFAEFVENALFEHGGVVFATLHVVGSNNGLAPWRGVDTAERSAAFARREQANLAWLRSAFTGAEGNAALGIVLLMQANPRPELPTGDAERRGFEALLEELSWLASRFGRPVLLAHGDGHVFFVDRPLTPNIVRVQVTGFPWLGWVHIKVDPMRPELFSIEEGEVRASAAR